MTSAGTRRQRHNRRAAPLALGTALVALALAAGSANGDGGITPGPTPEIKDVRCVARCLDLRTVAETGRAELTGKALDSVETVKVKAEDGRVEVEPDEVDANSVSFEVPEGARSGRPVALTESGVKVKSPVKLTVKRKDSVQDVEDFELKKVEATPTKTFYDGVRRSRVSYLFQAKRATDIRIDVLKGKRKRLVDSIVQEDQEPFANNRVRWNGLDEDRKVAPNGKYRFRISPLAGGGSGSDKFRFYDHRFPLAGRHTYGDGLGAGRGHMGQDVFARCGNKVYAARGGRVQTRAFQGAAGYYVVIDGRKTGVDYFYAHLERRGRPKEGEKVKTGEVIGYESDTGDAVGCHLHFEMWSAPGWYEGGHVLNPTPHLKRWDRWS